MKDRIYIDTSVVGGYFDNEFLDYTRQLFDSLRFGKVIFVVSDLLEAELVHAPEKVTTLLSTFHAEHFEFVELTQEAEKLATMYVEEGVVGPTSIDDCRHIALATINNVSVLASWNFKHIVNITRIRGYNSVNLREGYRTLEIRSPRDLVEEPNG